MKIRIPRLLVLTALAALAIVPLLRAQEVDAENCKDHPLLSRMKGFYIIECEKDFDAVEFPIADTDSKTIEGNKTFLKYYLKEGAPKPSFLQIRRNFTNALKPLGAKVLFDEGAEATYQLIRNGKETWIKLNAFDDGAGYDLIILELAEMGQEITADAMYDALSKDGFIALYINFDSGKSDLKPESQGTVDQITALMKAHEDLKISIEGHTDNVGTPAANKTLSEQRAKSVMAAVVKGGLDTARLSAVGWGQEKPVADNRSEDGRAKNRRVEIVKK